MNNMSAEPYNEQQINSRQYDKKLLAHVGGDDVFISGNVEIRRPHLIKIGNHIAIDSGFYITTQAELGDYIHIGPYVAVIGGAPAMLKMGNFTNIALGGRIICRSDKYMGAGLVTVPGIPEEYADELKNEPIIFDDFVNLAANAVILPGVHLAKGTVIGACSLVTKNTEPWTVYMGIPAKPVKVRPHKKIIEYAKRLGYER